MRHFLEVPAGRGFGAGAGFVAALLPGLDAVAGVEGAKHAIMHALPDRQQVIGPAEAQAR